MNIEPNLCIGSEANQCISWVNPDLEIVAFHPSGEMNKRMKCLQFLNRIALENFLMQFLG